LVPRKPSAEVDSPFIGRRIEGDTPEWYRELRRPPQFIPMGSNLPYGIPIHIRFSHIGIDESLTLGSVWVRSEIIAFPTSFKRIQQNEKIIVSLHWGISLHNPSSNFVGLRIEASNPNIEDLFVPTNPDLCFFRSRGTFHWSTLTKVLRQGSLGPAIVIQLAVYLGNFFNLWDGQQFHSLSKDSSRRNKKGYRTIIKLQRNFIHSQRNNRKSEKPVQGSMHGNNGTG
jgi:hypothetical protein